MKKIFFYQTALTLLELMITVIIVGIIAGVAIPNFTKSFEKQREKEAIAALEVLANAENRYYLKENTYYPSGYINDLATINRDLSVRIPNFGKWSYEISSNLNQCWINADRVSGGKEMSVSLQNGVIQSKSGW